MEEQTKAVTIFWPTRNHSITLSIQPTDSSHIIHERIRLLMGILGPWFLTDLLGCNVAAVHYNTLMDGERLTVNAPGTNPPVAASPSTQALLNRPKKRKADDEETARGGSYARTPLVASTIETGNDTMAAVDSPMEPLVTSSMETGYDDAMAIANAYSQALSAPPTNETAAVNPYSQTLSFPPTMETAAVNPYSQTLWVPPTNETDSIEIANNETPAMNRSIQELLSRRAMEIVNKQKAAASPPVSSQMLPPPVPSAIQNTGDETDSVNQSKQELLIRRAMEIFNKQKAATNPPASSQMLPPPIPSTQQNPDDEETDSAESDTDLVPAHKADYLWRVHRRVKAFGDELSTLDVAKSATQFNEYLTKGFENVLVNNRGRYIPEKISPFPHAVIRDLNKLWENKGWLALSRSDRCFILQRLRRPYAPFTLTQDPTRVGNTLTVLSQPNSRGPARELSFPVIHGNWGKKLTELFKEALIDVRPTKVPHKWSPRLLALLAVLSEATVAQGELVMDYLVRRVENRVENAVGWEAKHMKLEENDIVAVIREILDQYSGMLQYPEVITLV